MDRWDIALLAVAGYVAVMGLARLMIRRRDQLLQEFRQKMRAGTTHDPAGRQQTSAQRDQAA